MHEPDGDQLTQALERMRGAFLSSRPETLAVRRDRIERTMRLLDENAEALCDAMSADFGNRAREQSMLADILPPLSAGKYCLKNLSSWAKADKRAVQFPLNLMGAKAEVRYEPKGVVGNIAPWNFPVGLAFTPLMQIFAAGNRAMIKPSEITPRTSELVAKLVHKTFAPEECLVVTGGPDVAQAFSALPFDHLVFTGSTAVGRQVMEAAARNLTPVTLELGGKSPAIFGGGADLALAANRIVMGKLMNAGQVCIAPDYLLVREEDEVEAIGALSDAAKSMYPTIADNDDYAGIVSDKQFERLGGLLADAREMGADIIALRPDREPEGGNARKLPLTIVRKVEDDMAIMQEEIFGPLLPVLTYRSIDDAIARINRRDHPLALYYFGPDEGEREQVLTQTLSGGVTLDDTTFHYTVDTLPFGGVGPSGMGAYHGVEGFREFSHARAVYRQPKIDIAGKVGLRPPYGEATRKTIARLRKG